jgi:O-antigen/teichoic acid export membrane protein
VSISKHATYNVLGALVPLAITVATVPLYLALVGTDRYGVLAICWAVLGYVGFLDLGLGPAVAQKIAVARDGPPEDRARLFWTATWMSLALGAAGAAIFYLGTHLYFEHAANLGSGFRAELRDALPLLALMVPMAMLASVFTGTLQGVERFGIVNLANGTGTSLMTLLPLAAAWFIAPDLASLIGGALAARALTAALLFAACARAAGVGRPRAPSRDRVGPLLRFGGWVSVSSMAGPLLVTSDRLVIGATLNAAAVAVYAIPYNLVVRLAIVPSSLASAMFPRFAYADADERQRLIGASAAAVAVIITPAAIVGFGAVRPFFDLWIGEALAAQAAPVAVILIVGAYANSFGQAPFVMMQATGRPDVVSKLLLAEIIPYWAALLGGIYAFGLLGAAAAWALRAIADTLLLFVVARVRWAQLRALVAPAALVAAGALAAAELEGPLRYCAIAVLALASVVWGLFNMPDVLRSRLGAGALWLPRARSVPGGQG